MNTLYINRGASMVTGRKDDMDLAKTLVSGRKLEPKALIAVHGHITYYMEGFYTVATLLTSLSIYSATIANHNDYVFDDRYPSIPGSLLETMRGAVANGGKAGVKHNLVNTMGANCPLVAKACGESDVRVQEIAQGAPGVPEEVAYDPHKAPWRPTLRQLV